MREIKCWQSLPVWLLMTRYAVLSYTQQKALAVLLTRVALVS